jgi:hypothetical protein
MGVAAERGVTWRVLRVVVEKLATCEAVPFPEVLEATLDEGEWIRTIILS